MSPNTRTRRGLEGTLHPLQPDTPQAHPQFPEVIIQHRAGYPRVTERYAENLISRDSHGLIELQ